MFFPKSPPQSPTEQNKKHPYVTIDQPLKDVASFNEMKISKYCSSIIIKGKQLQNFLGLPQLEYLSQLQLDSNPIKSFEGAPYLPSLRWLSLKKSPLSRNIHFKLMCIVVFGDKLKTINNQKPPEKVIKQAALIHDVLYPELIKGRVISNMKPLRLIDTNESCHVSANSSLMEASTKVGYMAPSDLAFTKAVIQPDLIPPSNPSVASIIDEIISRNDEECYLPEDTISVFKDQLQSLRKQFNAEYYAYSESGNENESNDYSKSFSPQKSTKSESSISHKDQHLEEKEEEEDTIEVEQNNAINIASKLVDSESDQEPEPIKTKLYPKEINKKSSSSSSSEVIKSTTEIEENKDSNKKMSEVVDKYIDNTQKTFEEEEEFLEEEEIIEIIEEEEEEEAEISEEESYEKAGND